MSGHYIWTACVRMSKTEGLFGCKMSYRIVINEGIGTPDLIDTARNVKLLECIKLLIKLSFVN